MRTAAVRITAEVRPLRAVACLFLALNAFGYDDENNSRGMHASRRAARKALLRQNFRSRFLQLRHATMSFHPWRLLTLVLVESGSRVFLQEFRMFCREPMIRKLTVTTERHQRAEVRALLPILERELRRLVSLFGPLPAGTGRVVLVPNPLDAYWRGYQVRAGRTVYFVFGPGAARNRGELIRHELLHLFARRFRLPSSFAPRPSRWLARQGYSQINILREEYAVRALDALYRSRIFQQSLSRLVDRERREFPKIREAVALMAGRGNKRGRR